MLPKVCSSCSHLGCLQGPCAPCGVVSSVTCLCGGAARQLPCSQRGQFRCAAPCAKPLPCGLHSCERGCHADACGACPLAGPKACPCGKTRLQAAACDATVPPCGQTCDKLLACEVHRCMERCHAGACSQTCRSVVEKTCACGKTTKAVQCQERVRCERRCGEMRACERHPCKRRCCDGDCPPCPETCGRRLRCGNHKCPSPCHAGACSPCPLTVKISCACGRTSYQVPCGREATAPPPRCKHACVVPALCRHAAQLQPHACHFGPCSGQAGAAVCTLPCGSQLLCGHVCASAACHDPAPPAVAAFQAPPPPASLGADPGRRAAAPSTPPAVLAAQAAREVQRGADASTLACPPCTAPVGVTCLGGHSTQEVACSAARRFACSRPCGRVLRCGNHACASPCHDPAASPCTPCALPCQRRRACAHACPLPCHPAECPRCSLGVSRPCHCGKTSVQFECHQAGAGLPDEALQCGKPCHRALPRCPHLCPRSCHPGPCLVGRGACSADVAVRCSCKRLKQKIPCSEVAARLRAAGGDGVYTATTPLRLLPCDDECAAAAAAAARKAGAAAAAEEAAPAAKPVAAPAALVPQRKLTRAEREQQREQREAEKEQLQRAAARRQRVVYVAVAAAVAAVAVAVALLLSWLLAVVDRRAAAAWQPGSL